MKKILKNIFFRLKKIERQFEKSAFYLKHKEGVKFPTKNIVIITLDSLRFDVTQKAKTPNFDQLFKKYQNKGWYQVGSHGTYTLPSHISMFHAGMMPLNNRSDVPAPFNREKEKIFKAQLAWERTTGARFPTPAAPNIVKGFEKIGYRTVGVGGVGWFNDQFETSNIWKNRYFQEFYWKKEFEENDFNSLKNQIELIEKLKIREAENPVFFFLNVSVTHRPYLGFGNTLEGQIKAFEEVDKLLPDLLKVLPEKCDLMICSDHGECFGEDGLWGHGFYHPKVMEVPFAYLELTK